MGTATKTGILIFSAAILLGPWYSVDDYQRVAHTISQLGAQATRNNGIAIAGFIAFGAGICIDWFRHRAWSTVPFLLFGVFIAAAGLFPHKPITEGVPYNADIHQLHRIFAAASGLAITLGFLIDSARAKNWRRRSLATYMAAICVLLPLAMFAWPAYQGLIQRAMYFQVFLWLWVFFPPRDWKTI